MRRAHSWSTKLVVCLLAALASMVMVLGNAGKAAAAQTGTLRVGLTADFSDLNPFTATDPAAKLVLRYEYDSLVDYSQSNSPLPGMADNWTVSSDGLTWTYTMPLNRIWSDGYPITAQDAAYTLKLLTENPKLPAAAAVANVASFKALDDSHLEVKLAKAQAENPMLNVFIVPEHIWMGLDPAQPTIQPYSTSVVGSGPYTIIEHSGSQVSMRANPAFWRGTAPMTQLDFIRYPDATSAAAALKAGSIDLAPDLTPQLDTSLSDESTITRLRGAGNSYYGLLLNAVQATTPGATPDAAQTALSHPAFRQALVAGIDKHSLLESTYSGLGSTGVGLIPPAYPDYSHLTGDEITHNEATANTQLSTLGYSENADGVRTAADGSPLNFTILADADDSTATAIAEQLVTQFKTLGLTATVTSLNGDALNSALASGNYDAAVIQREVGPDAGAELERFSCLSGSTTASAAGTPCDSQLDKLYTQQSTMTDADQRASIIRQADTELYNQAALIVLYYPAQLEAFSNTTLAALGEVPSADDVTGIATSPLSYWGLYLAKAPQPASATPLPQPADPSEEQRTNAWVGVAAAIGITLSVLVALLAHTQIRATRESKRARTHRVSRNKHLSDHAWEPGEHHPDHGEFIGH